MSHSVQKGVIHSAHGIPQSPRWFSDGRLSFEFDGSGVTRVHYFYPAARLSSHVLFYRRLWDGFRVYLVQEGMRTPLEPGTCRVWPYGARLQWRHREVVLELEVVAVAEAIAWQLHTPAGLPGGVRFQLEFYSDFALTPADAADLRFADMGAERCWDDWRFDGGRNLLLGGFDDHPQDGTAGAAVGVTVAASYPLSYERKLPNVKHVLTGPQMEPGQAYRLLIDFNCGGDAAAQAVQKLSDLPALLAAQQVRYEQVARRSPRLISPDKALNDFVSLAPLYHEACKAPSVAGAIRASTVHYWVWGWDGMTSNQATACWGDSGFIADMLELYERTADPQEGIVHAFRYDMVPATYSALPAQGMYICLLHQYWACIGDMAAVWRHYNFARQTFQRVAAAEVDGTGFCRGTSLFPDFPDRMQETGEDLSLFNNTVFYCAARAMEALAVLTGDEPTATRSRDIVVKMEQSFARLFFDEDRGFVVSSVDARTLQRRVTFNLSGLKWENNYLQDLLAPVLPRCMDFVVRHLISPAGLREIPLWDPSFDGDANQLHCWWPVNSEFFARAANQTDRVELLDWFAGIVGRWTRKLCCPEGISYYEETQNAVGDRWNTLSGAWQAYSIRGWYQAVLHGIVGVDTDSGGVTFYPRSGCELRLLGLHFRNKVLDIAMKGSGRYVDCIDVNGRRITGTCKLPADCLFGAKRIKITVYRTEKKPAGLWVKQATGLEMSNLQTADGHMRATIRGAGLCRLRLGADSLPQARVDGQPCPVIYDAEAGLATVEIVFDRYEEKTLKIVTRRT